MKYKKTILVVILLISSLCLAAGDFIASPNETYADDIHYDASLHMIIIHVHAKALWFNIDDFYGLHIKNDKNIDKVMNDVLDTPPQIIHLKKVS